MSRVAGCACKRGFLVLRDCGRVATATCRTCGRPICDEHLVGVANECVDCAARHAERAALEDLPAEMTTLRGWRSAHARRTFYHGQRYHPFSTGWPTGYYDEYDVRAFDDDVDPTQFEGSGPSFLDSRGRSG